MGSIPNTPTNMKLKVIIFDFAGTLAYFKQSNNKKFFEPLKKSLKKFGFDIKGEKEMEEFSSALFNLCGKAESWIDLSKQITKVFVKKPKNKKIEELSEFLEKTFVMNPYDDVKEIINLPFRKAILSNAPRFLVEELDLKGFEVFTPKDTKFAKPDERAFFYVLKKMKIRPEEAIMIGDTLEKDIAPALRIGMQAVLVDRNNKIETLYKKISSLSQLKTILGL